MELIDSLMQVTEKVIKSKGMTDLVIGTVTKTNPLEVTLVSTMLPLPSAVLELTESVVEKKITVPDHRHDVLHSHTIADTYTGGGTCGTSNVCSTELNNVYCYENGAQLPRENGFIIINKALAINDKVLMLRVLNGQKFIILSRVFGGE